MFYRTRSASDAKQRQKTRQGRPAARNEGRGPAHAEPSDWLGWDAWVNPGPAGVPVGGRDGRLA